jgi:hypothetical protein
MECSATKSNNEKFKTEIYAYVWYGNATERLNNILEEQIHNENFLWHVRNRSVWFGPSNLMLANFRYWDCAGSQYGFVSGSCRKIDLHNAAHSLSKAYVLRTKGTTPKYKFLFYSILFWLYSPLLDLGRFYTVGRTPWKEDQPVPRPLPTLRTRQNRINAHRHPCLEWNSNPQSQRLGGRRQFVPETAQPLRSAGYKFLQC